MFTVETVFESWPYPLFLYALGQVLCASLHIYKTGSVVAFTCHGTFHPSLVAVASYVAKAT